MKIIHPMMKMVALVNMMTIMIDTTNDNSGDGNTQVDEDDCNKCENGDSQYNNNDCLIFNIQN